MLLGYEGDDALFVLVISRLLPTTSGYARYAVKVEMRQRLFGKTRGENTTKMSPGDAG